MRLAFRAIGGGGESDEVVQVGYGDSYLTFFDVYSVAGGHGRQPQVIAQFTRGFTGWACTDSRVVEGREIALHLEVDRPPIEFDDSVNVRRCRLERRRLTIDFDAVSTEAGPLEGLDIELELDWRDWSSLRWGVEELFKGDEGVLHVEEADEPEEVPGADRTEVDAEDWPRGTDPWTDDAGDIPF